MKKTQSEVVVAEVRRVQQEFNRWRAKKQASREAIPSRLWQAAAKLCGTHGVGRISRWMRVDYTKLKAHAGRSAPKCRKPSRPSFVEWSPPVGSVPDSSAEYIVELADGSGGVQRIHARGVSVGEIAALSRELRSGES